jgi:glutamate dehydrogenase (NAD(P)+)
MSTVFQLVDEYGPAKIIHVCEPSIGLRATLVIDNVAMGPSIGGIRLTEAASTEDCARLARAMTLKSAAAGLPYGGSKAVIYSDPKVPKMEKQRLIRAFAYALRNEREYVFAPDMGTDEECMAWVKDETGRAVGLPKELGGIPLDEIGATGWGLYHATDVALHYRYFKLDDARVIVQGFGAVGRHVARFLTENGAILVGASDRQGGIYNSHGLSVKTLVELKDQGQSVSHYPDGDPVDAEALIQLESDIFIPAAQPDALTEENVDRLKTKLVVEGGNISVTPAAERRLHEQGVLCVPDFIANAGGLICAAMENKGGTQMAAMASIKERVRRNTEKILEESHREGILPRDAALRLATRRLRRAMSYRRWSLF